jgi:hypothetical protein
LKSYKFEGSKFITRGIQTELPPTLVNYLWDLIEKRRNNHEIPMDYLQVFELEPEDKGDGKHLTIIHSQEVPSYKRIYRLKFQLRINSKIFVIDDQDHCTMLFSHEY